MSLSGALSNATSGLNANARGTSVISSNIANALNEYYGPRAIALGADATQTSGGVRVHNVTRQYNPILAFQKRQASADLGQAQVTAQSAQQIEALWGSVDTLGSVAQKLTKFETALSAAATDPSSDLRLQNVALTADGFAASIRSASDGIQSMRENADAAIATIVDQLNTGLKNIDDLNAKIELAKYTGSDALALYDQRDAELGKLSEFIPLHVIERDSGAVAVFSRAGQTLLDVSPVAFSFDATPTILPHMTAANGLISGLSINGQSVDPGQSGMLAGGALAAHFNVRDVQAPEAQVVLDAIARDVIDRFGASGPDTTLGAADLGAFTDGGAFFVPANEIGLAGRLELNSALSTQNADLWRWRDGIQATSPGEPGASGLLNALKNQISTSLVPSSPNLGATARSLVGHVHQFGSSAAAERLRSNDRLDFATAQFTSAQEAVAATGVNTDAELQNLIELEKSFAANARVIQVVDDMLSELLRF